MWTRSRYHEEIEPGHFALCIDSYEMKRHEAMWDQLVVQETSKKARETDIERSGLPLPSRKGEGAPIEYGDQIRGQGQTWIHDVYALGVRITEEAIEDNLYELNNGKDGLGEIYYDLGEAMAENEETLAARLFNYGTATTYHTTRNGYQLFYASHPRLDGSTFSNIATSADLTYTAFWSAVVAAENQLNHQQFRVRKMVKNLWVPPQLERQALEILKSTDRPDVANRATNAMIKSGRKIDLKVWAHMTDEDMWVLQTDGKGIIRFNRRKTRFAKERDFQTGDMMIKGDQRFSYEIKDHRCFYGNIPA